MLVIWAGVIQVILLWLLAALAKERSSGVGAIVFLMLVANVGHAVLVLKYFFLLPALFDFAVAFTLQIALISIMRPKNNDAN